MHGQNRFFVDHASLLSGIINPNDDVVVLSRNKSNQSAQKPEILQNAEQPRLDLASAAPTPLHWMPGQKHGLGSMQTTSKSTESTVNCSHFLCNGHRTCSGNSTSYDLYWQQADLTCLSVQTSRMDVVQWRVSRLVGCSCTHVQLDSTVYKLASYYMCVCTTEQSVRAFRG